MLQQAYAREESYLETLEPLVALESPTGSKPAADRLAEHLQAVLGGDGWQLERIARDEVGDILCARVGVELAGSPTLLLTHYDTVWPLGTLAQMPLRRDGDLLYGPGVCDMKAGIASAIVAWRLLRDEGRALRGPVTLLLTSDEETGSHHSRALIEELARRHDRVLVLEPSRDDGAVKIGRKGVGDYRVAFRGRSAHAGNNPEDGASALRELAHFLLFAEGLSDPAAATTVNLTVAQGGSATNVIAESATARVDVRVLSTSEAERVDAALRSYRARDHRVEVALAGGLNRPPLEPNPENLELWREAQAKLRGLGLTLEAAVVGGGSDGNFTSALGVPTLDGLGASGAGPHARHEHIRLRQTLERVALLAELLGRGEAPA